MNTLALLLLALALSDSPVSPSLEDILAHTAGSVARFWEQFSAVNCTESVTQEKIGKQGKTVYRHDSMFDYLILMNLQADDLSVEESRILQREAGKVGQSAVAHDQRIFHPSAGIPSLLSGKLRISAARG